MTNDKRDVWQGTLALWWGGHPSCLLTSLQEIWIREIAKRLRSFFSNFTWKA